VSRGRAAYRTPADYNASPLGIIVNRQKEPQPHFSASVAIHINNLTK
jgi:hypothetical protein